MIHREISAAAAAAAVSVVVEIVAADIAGSEDVELDYDGPGARSFFWGAFR
jgi:hypothetical protein